MSLISGLNQAVAAIDALGEYAVAQAEFQQLRQLLTESIEDLEARPMSRTPSAAFGESYWGGNLGHHTGIAERHVAEAIDDLVTGLTEYREAVDYAERTAVDTDDDVAARLRALAAAPIVVDGSTIADGSSCVDQPDLTTNDSCEP
jgi:hypothetical protein